MEREKYYKLRSWYRYLGRIRDDRDSAALAILNKVGEFWQKWVISEKCCDALEYGNSVSKHRWSKLNRIDLTSTFKMYSKHLAENILRPNPIFVALRKNNIEVKHNEN